jgi:hypothetical protein
VALRASGGATSFGGASRAEGARRSDLKMDPVSGKRSRPHGGGASVFQQQTGLLSANVGRALEDEMRRFEHVAALAGMGMGALLTGVASENSVRGARLAVARGSAVAFPPCFSPSSAPRSQRPRASGPPPWRIWPSVTNSMSSNGQPENHACAPWIGHSGFCSPGSGPAGGSR